MRGSLLSAQTLKERGTGVSPTDGSAVVIIIVVVDVSGANLT